MEELFTVREVASQLKVHPMTVYRWISIGRLGSIRLDRKSIRIPVSKLRTFCVEYQGATEKVV